MRLLHVLNLQPPPPPPQIANINRLDTFPESAHAKIK